jgi:hypothetical protein
MPRTTFKNSKIRKTLQRLNDEVRILSKLGEERLKNAQDISLPHVSLSDLKDQYKQSHRKLDPALTRQEEKGQFRYFASDSDRYLVIKDGKGRLLACRAPIRDPKVVQTLTTSMTTISPDEISKKSNGLDRGDHCSRFYYI